MAIEATSLRDGSFRMHRAEERRAARREATRSIARSLLVIIDPRWLTGLRTFMIHANGLATSATRREEHAARHAHTHTHTRARARSSNTDEENTTGTTRAGSSARASRVRDARFMALGHANLVARSSTREKPRPSPLLFFSLFPSCSLSVTTQRVRSKRSSF